MTESPDLARLAECARQACYVGSAEHKSYPSFAGEPRLRSDATKCDPSLEREKITTWLHEGLRAGTVSALWDEDYPRYVWRRVDGVVYEGRLVNSGLGQYKGYALNPDEFPVGMK